jgi:hypothetical protein
MTIPDAYDSFLLELLENPDAETTREEAVESPLDETFGIVERGRNQVIA